MFSSRICKVAVKFLIGQRRRSSSLNNNIDVNDNVNVNDSDLDFGHAYDEDVAVTLMQSNC